MALFSVRKLVPVGSVRRSARRVGGALALTAAFVAAITVPTAVGATDTATYLVGDDAGCLEFIAAIGGTGTPDGVRCTIYSGTLPAGHTAAFAPRYELRVQFSSNGSPNAVDFTNLGTFEGVIYLAGTMVNGGVVNSNFTQTYGTFVNTGTLNVLAGGSGLGFAPKPSSLYVNGPVLNFGTVNVADRAILRVDVPGAFVNTCSVGVINVASGGSVIGEPVDDCPPFFQAPIDEQPVMNVAKAGSIIPVRFSLGGYQGMSVLESLTSTAVSCPTSGAVDPIETTAPLTLVGLTYNAATDTYTATWKTSKAWASTCRQLVATVSGETHTALFSFK